ncbi:hypothetical protein KCP73_00460 [Salmonella enterica subsp. enterica]|nr:hypothetical protein KCP73_00460 [Salmonella enterica subsp. enterica]
MLQRKCCACVTSFRPSAAVQYLSLCPSAIIISVTVELTASVPMAAVKSLSEFSKYPARGFSRGERAVSCAKSSIAN